MSSTNYSITTSVFSGGGSVVSSANYQNDGANGQPTPLKKTSSTSYDLYPGFWFTVGVEISDDPLADIKVNGSDSLVTVPYGTAVRVAISLDAAGSYR